MRSFAVRSSARRQCGRACSPRYHSASCSSAAGSSAPAAPRPGSSRSSCGGRRECRRRGGRWAAAGAAGGRGGGGGEVAGGGEPQAGADLAEVLGGREVPAEEVTADLGLLDATTGEDVGCEAVARADLVDQRAADPAIDALAVARQEGAEAPGRAPGDVALERVLGDLGLDQEAIGEADPTEQ